MFCFEQSGSTVAENIAAGNPPTPEVCTRTRFMRVGNLPLIHPLMELRTTRECSRCIISRVRRRNGPRFFDLVLMERTQVPEQETRFGGLLSLVAAVICFMAAQNEDPS